MKNFQEFLQEDSGRSSEMAWRDQSKNTSAVRYHESERAAAISRKDFAKARFHAEERDKHLAQVK